MNLYRPYTIYENSDREICRTCRICPADFCWCPTEISDFARHFVQQGSTHIKCPTRKTRMNTDICQSTGKMSDRDSKCPAEHWMPAGHFVRHARNKFRDHCKNIAYGPSQCTVQDYVHGLHPHVLNVHVLFCVHCGYAGMVIHMSGY